VAPSSSASSVGDVRCASTGLTSSRRSGTAWCQLDCSALAGVRGGKVRGKG
jgi:hypothetical protein